jgi:hypothetical protein
MANVANQSYSEKAPLEKISYPIKFSFAALTSQVNFGCYASVETTSVN